MHDMGSGKRFKRGVPLINPSHKGDLHSALGVKQGEKIPASKLAKAAHSDNPHLKKMAVFAKNARKWG
jgi:hypothetical protein